MKNNFIKCRCRDCFYRQMGVSSKMNNAARLVFLMNSNSEGFTFTSYSDKKIEMNFWDIYLSFIPVVAVEQELPGS